MDNKRYRDTDNEAASASGKRARLDPAGPAGPGDIKNIAHQVLFRDHNSESNSRNGSGFLAVNDSSHAQLLVASAHDHRTSRPNGPVSGHDSAANSTYASRNGNVASRTNSASHTVIIASDRAPLETITDVSRQFKQAVSTGWDRRSPTYAGASVLLLYWEQDSDEVKEATWRLDSVFRHSFNYATETVSIPSTDAERVLNSTVEAFFSKNNTPENLAILHYAGRCLASETPGAPPIWMPRHDGADIAIDSGAIESAYNGSLCDVLLLLDHNCIRHPQYTKNPLGTARRKAVEVIDAPPVESEQAHVSFTKALADELSTVAYGDSLLVETLHKRVAARMTIHKPRGRGRPPKEPVPRPIADQQHLPNHYYLQEFRSIVLAPIPNEPQGK
ncbi:hypothetical protein SPBR_03768 [Sporothrix brasiliensis 5110]|uniref:Uncharacterized protein n=1 Tax=Sporothrix brasiliensis 5110 TaxID=1398154 RepID=A0A0C2J7M0_9PEZI|nr:uncharacterized protein SPBR_03768 [Sporothrix brasiliensis 5110]KIH94995.1 hypothetical protein SPBR_03768 [Sporothrix brasiliensis 5110]